MRKIAANYVFPVAGEPIRNGYVKFNDNNEVVEIGSTLAWKIPWTEEPDRLESMGSQRVGHD